MYVRPPTAGTCCSGSISASAVDLYCSLINRGQMRRLPEELYLSCDKDHVVNKAYRTQRKAVPERDYDSSS